ncbi:hypothetical protein Q8791_21990 [Nocardiopsis sp. CT-R113]|uniref:Uncharacterized protein n=1 Tax=Nocardiopsis codii TaxID=3065942 RepID=A0ABU7KCC9_9ACTN|nr:hypothetical protein [Nocardiopsis sp. CT-R113]MEE2039889.1 hypothetical protein [Nocardiopsis sp. CT-R113]
MFNTARTTAKTLLVAASAASFVALGAGIAGADTLGGVTDGLPLGDLGSQVPSQLTEGVSTPLGDLVKVTPGQISAQPDVRHQAAPAETAGHAVGGGVSAPVETGEENSANVGPLDLGAAREALPLGQGADPVSGAVGGLGLLESLGLGGGGTLPLSHGADPVSGAVGGLGLLESLGLGGGGTLPLSHGADPVSGAVGGLGLLESLGLGGGGTLPLSHGASPVRDSAGTAVAAVSEVGSTAEQGVHEVGSGLSSLDAPLPVRGETLPLAAADTPVGPVDGKNTDLTGGAGTLVSDLVLSDDVLPMAGSAAGVLDGAPVSLPSDELDLSDATGIVGSTLPQSAPAAGDLGLPELPAPGDVLPLAAPETTAAVTDLVGQDALGNDLVGVRGLPTVGEPTIETGPVTDLLPAGTV